MKKIFSVFLAVLLIFSCSVIAFADDTVQENQSFVMTIAQGKELVKKFTPEQDGIYMLKVFNLSSDIDDYYYAYGSVEKDGDTLAFSDMFSADNVYNNFCYFFGDAGTTYDLVFNVIWCGNKEDNYTFSADAVVTRVASQEINSGGAYKCETGYNLYTVNPPVDTEYNISSDAADTEIVIYSHDGFVAQNGQQNPDNRINYTFKLKGGEAYFIRVLNSVSSPFNISVKDGTKQLPESVNFYDVEIPENTSIGFYYSIYPCGSEINSAGVDVNIADPDIATLYYNEEFDCYTITGVKSGKTTITVTEKTTGVSHQGTITVETELYYKLANSPLAILRFFAKILGFFLGYYI